MQKLSVFSSKLKSSTRHSTHSGRPDSTIRNQSSSSVLFTGSTLVGLILTGTFSEAIFAPSAAAFGFAPVNVQISVNRVWGNPTLDLPPQRQQPELYAKLSMLGESLITPVEITPRINEDIFPDWRFSAVSEQAWLEAGHPIIISVRIFDEDDGDDDDKVLFSSLSFDPYTCQLTIGEQAIAGNWINRRTTCVVTIPDIQSQMGSAALTISSQWLSPDL